MIQSIHYFALIYFVSAMLMVVLLTIAYERGKAIHDPANMLMLMVLFPILNTGLVLLFTYMIVEQFIEYLQVKRRRVGRWIQKH